MAGGKNNPKEKSDRQETQTRIILADVGSLGLRDCVECKEEGPLDFWKTCEQHGAMYLKVICQKCEHINSINLFSSHGLLKIETRGRKQNPLARRTVLGCLHQGLDHSHYEGLMAAMNAKAVASSMFKHAEREVGKIMENTTCESCSKTVSNRFFGIRNLAYSKAGIQDFGENGERDSGL